jgi:hypothetical protein
MELHACTFELEGVHMSQKNFLHKNRWFSTKKHGLPLLSVVLITSTLVISYSLVLATSSGHIIQTASPETQFKIDLAYAYAGQWTANTSYTDSNGHQMSLVSLYPSVVMLNVTRLPGAKIPSCDAVIEVYEIQITTDTDLYEKFAYAIGTNYSSSFSPSKIQPFVSHVGDLVDKMVYRGGYEGTISLNWTDNSSIMTNIFGSACIYSSRNSALGLWKAGTPNTISIAVSRIGYLTMNDDSVMVYKDAATKTAATAQLDNYGEGYLYNSIVPADKLPQTNLFAPKASDQPVS